MLINIRGSFGSGKSTIVNSFLEVPGEPIHLLDDLVSRPTKADPKRLVKKPLYARTGPGGVVAVGRYRAACGGCDEYSWKGAHDAIELAIKKSATLGDFALFEGVTISGIYQRYINLANEMMRDTGRQTHVVFVMPPVEECIRRVALRSGRGVTERMEKSVTDKWEAVKRTYDKMSASPSESIVLHYRDSTESATDKVRELIS